MSIPTKLVADGGSSALNVTAATNLFAGVGTVYKVIVVVSAANACSIIDSTGTTPTSANTILSIPASAAVGTIYTLNWPVTAGLSVVPGASVTLSVSYSSGQLG